MLTELKEKGNGFPCALIPDDIGENITEEVEKKCREKWNEILDAIIEGFEEYKKLSSCLLHPDFKMEKFEKGFALFKKHFSSLWY
ncbi:MAG: hypothetical protein GX638_11900 [Crenarchaeota archaeon]|nr:hypothetical protein [Thermoproteota archaeon]